MDSHFRGHEAYQDNSAIADYLQEGVQAGYACSQFELLPSRLASALYNFSKLLSE
ncbi:MAG: hypothetical protein ACP5M0_12440 [Desulfomonilaceae bacterium]